MRVAELTAFHLRIPLRRTIRHASHTRTSNETLVVRCRLDDGTAGWGEGLPRTYVTGETIDTAFDSLKATDWTSVFGPKFDRLEDAISLARSIRLENHAKNGRDCFGNATRCAVELAFLDAACRAFDVPLSHVTGQLPETAAIRGRSERVRYSGVMTSMGSVRAFIQSWKFRLYGFHQAKVKVGVAGADDRASLARIRRILGTNVDLRIDANEAWTCEELERRLEPLTPFEITSVEQPVPHERVDGLAEIRPRLSTPIMLDESLCSLTDGQKAIERSLCDLFNIRLSKCGGFLQSLKLAAMAQRAGLGYQLGCQVGETGILSAAGRHFASSVADIRYVEGSFDRHLVKERLTVQDLTFGPSGYAPELTGPGLGVDIDEDAVERTCVRRENWTIG